MNIDEFGEGKEDGEDGSEGRRCALGALRATED